MAKDRADFSLFSSQDVDHESASSPLSGEALYDSIEGLVSSYESTVTKAAAKALPEKTLVEETVYGPFQALYTKGLLQQFRAQPAEAVVSLETAYNGLIKLKCYSEAIQSLIELAWTNYDTDNPDLHREGKKQLSEAAALIERYKTDAKVAVLQGKLLHYQGLVSYREKKYGEALKKLLLAKSYCRANSLDLAKISDSMAVYYEHTNDYFRALQCLSESLIIKRSLGCTYEKTSTLQIMGRIYLLREEFDKAANCLVNALTIALSSDDHKRYGRIKNDLVRLAIYQGNFRRASQLIAELEIDCQDKSLRALYAKSQFYKAYIEFTTAHYDNAKALLKNTCLPIFKKYNDQKSCGKTLRLLASIHYHCGNPTQAIQEMSTVIGIFKATNSVTELAKTHYEFGKIYSAMGEDKLALASMLETLRIAETNGLNFMISHIEDEIFRLDEKKWLEIVEKRANHDRVFEKEISLVESLEALGQTEKAAESVNGLNNKVSANRGLSDDPSLESGSPSEPYSSEPNKRLISLLRVGQAMAAERDLDKLLSLIKTETEEALNAERCTVFLYDKAKNELWSKVATGLDTTEEIRMPAHLGLVGYVVKTGDMINIKDAYQDPRFNADVDIKTGYKTHTILCMPMLNRKLEIIGAFQVLNKRNTHFNKVDENLLTAISTNAGVAIENAQLTQEMKVSFESFVKTLSSTIDARDPITAGHSERVAEYALILGEEMEMDEDNLEALKYASLLHDIGKIGIREDILKKDGRLTEREYRHIQQHVKLTHEILQNVHFENHLHQVPEIAASHHEKIDGSGYHRGLKGSEILLSGRILAISDVFDAITSKRHYRNRMAFDKVLGILQRDAGTHFDSQCIEHFFKIPLVKLCDVLAIETKDNRVDPVQKITLQTQELINMMDKTISVGEYFNVMKQDQMSLQEGKIHKIFNMLYHQVAYSDLD
ncbi:MAG: HD domain-containing phosphohydrolase [Cyanobacteria bacterium P01_H01_bin.74]